MNCLSLPWCDDFLWVMLVFLLFMNCSSLRWRSFSVLKAQSLHYCVFASLYCGQSDNEARTVNGVLPSKKRKWTGLIALVLLCSQVFPVLRFSGGKCWVNTSTLFVQFSVLTIYYGSWTFAQFSNKLCSLVIYKFTETRDIPNNLPSLLNLLGLFSQNIADVPMRFY